MYDPDETGDFPAGAQFDPNAPYNEDFSKVKTKEVTYRFYFGDYVDVTLHIPEDAEERDYKDEAEEIALNTNVKDYESTGIVDYDIL